MRRNHGLPLRLLPLSRLSALSWLPGHSPARLARCAALGKAVMSDLISATRLQAAPRSTPGTVIQRATASASSWCCSPSCSSRTSSAWISAFEEAILAEQAIQQEPVAIANATVQRQLELRNLAAQLTQGETGQSLWTVLAADDRVQHRLPTFAHGVGYGAGKLDVGALQQLLDAAADARLLLRERGPEFASDPAGRGSPEMEHSCHAADHGGATRRSTGSPSCRSYGPGTALMC
jgi:hypothetical protein